MPWQGCHVAECIGTTAAPSRDETDKSTMICARLCVPHWLFDVHGVCEFLPWVVELAALSNLLLILR